MGVVQCGAVPPGGNAYQGECTITVDEPRYYVEIELIPGGGRINVAAGKTAGIVSFPCPRGAFSIHITHRYAGGQSIESAVDENPRSAPGTRDIRAAPVLKGRLEEYQDVLIYLR